MERKKQKKLLEIQTKIHDLRVLMLKIDELIIQRDVDFLKILKELGKFTKIDLVKQLEADKAKLYAKGIHWKPEDSIKWLIMWFDHISKDNK